MPTRAKTAKNRHHRNRVGGRDQGPEHQRILPHEILLQMQGVHNRSQDHGGQGHCRGYARHGQRGNGQAVAPEFPELDVKGGLKQQARQEYGKEQLLGQMGRGEQVQHAEP